MSGVILNTFIARIQSDCYTKVKRRSKSWTVWWPIEINRGNPCASKQLSNDHIQRCVNDHASHTHSSPERTGSEHTGSRKSHTLMPSTSDVRAIIGVDVLPRVGPLHYKDSLNNHYEVIAFFVVVGGGAF